jgi:hypothetical protein
MIQMKEKKEEIPEAEELIDTSHPKKFHAT